ncbi:hypothetical protein EMMF5_001833 [Cystobasidiomycetes sp. EMM_F5]
MFYTQTMADLSGQYDASLADVSYVSTGAFNVGPGGPPELFDIGMLTDFDDEAALVNDVLASATSGNALQNGMAGLGIDDVGTANAISTLNNRNGQLSLLELDARLSSLLGALESASHDTSAQVERGIEEVSRTIPRLTFDLQLMRENVLLLRFTLDSIRKKSVEATAQSETGQVLRRLRVLSTIKSRMEAARDILQEAEAWSSLESEVTSLIQEQAYVKAAERLSEANKSMVVFTNSPEYEQRRSLMVSLQNGLEAGLSASLLAAIEARDVTACQQYWNIFGQIQRESEYRKYYFNSRGSEIVKLWQKANLSDCATAKADSLELVHAQAAITLSDFLPTFYSALSETVKIEVKQFQAIFPDPLTTLSAFLQTTLESLSPSFPQRISEVSNTHGSRMLLDLIKLYKAASDFSIATDQIFQKLAVESANPQVGSYNGSQTSLTSQKGQGPTSTSLAMLRGMQPSDTVVVGTPAVKQPSVEHQRSRRQSQARANRQNSRAGSTLLGSLSAGNGILEDPEHNGTNEGPSILPWETAVFEPFLEWQAEYADLESRLLQTELQRVTNGQDMMAQLLTVSSGRSIADDGSISATSVHDGVIKAFLSQTLAVFGLAEEAYGRMLAFTYGYGSAAYVEAIDGVFKNYLLKQRDTLLRVKDALVRRRSANGAVTSSVQATDDNQQADSIEEDWSSFQLALRLLETCRSVWDRNAEIENRLRSRLLDVARLLRSARQDHRNQVVPGITRGALALLYQSSLNSASLSQLLEIVEKSHNASLPQGYSASHTVHAATQSPLLFLQTRNAIVDLTRGAQLFLHDIILAPILSILKTYSALPYWSQSSDVRPEGSARFDLNIPKFSLSPSEQITRVGEGLFNLPGMFEVYAADDALGFSLETLPGLDTDTIRQLRKDHPNSSLGLIALHTSPQPSPHLQAHRHRASMSLSGNEFLSSPIDHTPRKSPIISTHHSSFSQSHNSANSAQSTPLDAETVVSAWLSSLTRSVLLHIAKDVLPSIRALSKHGAEQLLSDLSYISNVAKALDVEVEQIEKWKAALDDSQPAQEGEGVNVDGTDQADSNSRWRTEANEIVEVVQKLRSARPALTRMT